jgi:transposase-like protein
MEEAKQPEPKLNGSKIPPVKPGKKRKFDLEFKKQIAMRVKSGETLTAISKSTGVSTSQVKRWSQGEGLGRMGGGHHKRKRKSSGKPAVKPSLEAKGVMSKAELKEAQRRTRSKDETMLIIPRALKDAVYFLELAETWSYQALRSGEIDKLDTAHDHARSALRELKKLTG